MSQVIPFPVQQTPSVPQAVKPSRYAVQYGEKYERGLDVAEIAKQIRAELKAQVKTRQLPKAKYSVTIQRFSGGCSLDVKIDQVESHSLMLNPARVQWEQQHPHELCECLPRLSAAGKQLIQSLESLVAAYNFDGSDTASDYWNVNFYSDISFTGAFVQAQRALILECME